MREPNRFVLQDWLAAVDLPETGPPREDRTTGDDPPGASDEPPQEKAPEQDPPADTSRRGWGGMSWWTAILLLGLFTRMQDDRNRPAPAPPGYPGGSHARSPRSSTFPTSLLPSQTTGHLFRGSRIAAYWQQTVGAVHRFRFETPRPSDEPARAYYRRRYADFRAAMQQAEAASDRSIDPDVVAMVQQHRELDRAELELCEAGLRWFTAQNPQGESRSLEENLRMIEPGLELFSGMTDEEFGRLPVMLQQIISDTFDLQEKRATQLREIELMQARLSERYGRPFPLPQLQQEEESEITPEAEPAC